MAEIESVEYYATCPSCGASNGNKKVCEYCGTSLIKKRNFDPDRELVQEDIDIPVVKGSLISDDEFLLVFSLIFGGIFVLVPTVLCIVFSGVGLMEPFMFAFFSLFWIIGFGSFVPLISKTIKKAKIKKSEAFIGEVRGYENGSVVINGRLAQSIRIKIYENGSPVIYILSTGGSAKSYAVGSKIKLKRYENSFMIL